MIPKQIHYCWFGRNPLPKMAKKCIASWRKYLPDYDIIEWNEDNFDVNAVPYVAEAYAARKYAFVSDYARFKILYEHGGLYFDTDVELIRPVDDIVARGAFMGFETDCGKEVGLVNPGLGLGAEKGHPVYRDMLDYYENRHFLNPDGTPDTTTIVIYTTDILKKHGLKNVPGIQEVEGIYFYPREYFNPFEWKKGLPEPTENTRSIHWYAKTWVSPQRRFYQKFKYYSNRIFGRKIVVAVRKLLGIKEATL